LAAVFEFLAAHQRELYPDELFADLFPRRRVRRSHVGMTPRYQHMTTELMISTASQIGGCPRDRAHREPVSTQTLAVRFTECWPYGR
jgi:hypothetical protein